MEDILFFNFNEKSSVLLIAFFNALVFSFLLLKNGLEEQRTSSRWLAAFIFLGGLYITPFLCGYAGWYGKDGYRELLYFLPLQQVFLLGPVFYFYVKSLLNNQFKFFGKDFLHFVPAIAYGVYSLVVFLYDVFLTDDYFFYANGRDKDLDFWYQMSGLISMLFYLGLSLKYYRQYRQAMVQEVSYADEIAFNWVKNFAITFGLILLLRVLFFILNPEWGQFGSKYWYYLCFSALLLYISITGYSNTVRTSLKLAVSRLPKPDSNHQATNARTEPEQDSAADLVIWKSRITELFEVEEAYQNPSLTLTNVAEQLSVNRNTVSKAINGAFNMNFNDFVNQKRAEAVIEKLKKGEHTHSTLVGIAYDCGFNSKTTFNRAFKKFTGVTPKQYIADNKL